MLSQREPLHWAPREKKPGPKVRVPPPSSEIQPVQKQSLAAMPE